MSEGRRPPLARRWWTWPLVVIAVGAVAGVALSAAGLGFGRGEQRTLFTVDACPDPSPGPGGDLPAPKDPVAAAVRARWQGDAPQARAQEITALLSPAYPGAHEQLGVCQRGDLAIYASPGGNGAGDGPRLGVLPGGRCEIRTTGGQGRVVIAESVSAQQSVPDYGANDFASFPGWYLTAVDPAPGTYRWTTAATWQSGPGAPAEPGTLVVELTLG